MGLRTAACALAACAGLLGSPLRVRADEPLRSEEPVRTDHPPSAQASPEALEHYARGKEHFRAGRYGEAIVELKAALALDPTSANLMYNVAYTSELLGNLKEAIGYYRRYLLVLPASEAAERDKINVALHRLEGRLAEQPVAAPQATTAPPPPAANGLGRADVWFWASLGGGVALLGGGVATGVLAVQREHQVKSFVAGKDGTLADRKSLVDQTHTFALASDIMTGVGAALVVTAALLFFLRAPAAEHPPDAQPEASITITGHSASLTLRGHL